MSTYIELVKATRLLCGMQGQGPSSVKNNVGIEEVLVRFVRDAYIDVQNLRETWQWLEDTHTFSTTQGQDTYSTLDIFGTTAMPVKTYQTDSFIITDEAGKKKYLRNVDRDSLEQRYLNSDDESLPKEFAIDPASKGLILKNTPDDAYNLSFRFQRVPEILSENTDVPKLPISFHNLILYKAVEKMSTYLSSPELFGNYSLETARMQGQLMRSEVPSMRMAHGRFS